MFSSQKTREAEVRAAGANPTLGGIAAGSRRPTQHSSGRGPDAKQEVGTALKLLAFRAITYL
jgi:hypothetical protein